jgi:hypothetical protein
MSESIIKRARVSFTGDNPMEFIDAEEQDISALSNDQRDVISRMGATVRAYLRAARELVASKYAHISHLVPPHLTAPGTTLVACCPGGAVIRYEKGVGPGRLLAAWVEEDLSQIAAWLSQNVIRCHTGRQFVSTVATSGFQFKLSATDPTSNQARELLSARIGFDSVIERPERLPQPPQKPLCLLSVRSVFEFCLLGEVVGRHQGLGEGQQFVLRSALRIPVGWDCIEIYPYLDLEHWKTEYAPIWAENDILASVLAQQLQEAHFQSLDPQAEARRLFGALLKAFKGLLDSEPDREEALQSFLQEHPLLLCPAHTKMWPKLALGAKKTDFVFRDAVQDYLLVELEKSSHGLFRQDGHPSGELNEARGQIADWKRYLEDNLATAQRELGLAAISSNPRSLIVIGRSSALTPENRRKLATMENEHPKLKIMTYDDVYANAKAVIENILGPIWDVVGSTQIYYLKR